MPAVSSPAGASPVGAAPLGAADLHVHSNVSDGTETPATLMAEAADVGLAALALTDHDATTGWAEAADAVERTGVALIPGMELSTRDGFVSVHVLGYLFDPFDETLLAETARIRESRLTRAETIVRRISRDYDLTWDDVLEQTAEGATIGRPHIADALVARGHVPNRSAAFAGILHPRNGYAQPHYAPDPVTGVRLIRAAGGVPVLAHPGTRGAERIVAEHRLRQLADAGLFGIEVDHPENLPDAKARLRELAPRYGLEITGSSDYHGTGKTNRLGEHRTAAEVVARLIAEGTGSSPVLPSPPLVE
ncbi:PHP domain-containing protein [Agromyces aerolatus]|uniref:PHP domain-containing protein n=1 Tax=Agromyces sp. LY-1074 TaxID=3074080 RepID=UPI00285B22CF|nr:MULTISPECIES: PHP domain-containing protein [unclassified Agromyces]MDR5698929.1 PHP domain-containing protein [Agromyces sp. LY-1074]MDR5705293.1 PHP domain-containing protein [Agromyces sp. LY-1358]